MRIGTSSLFSTSVRQMASLTERADALQTQVSTGVRYTRPSDNSTAYRQLETLKRVGAEAKAFENNIKLAQGVLAQGDSVLGSIENQLNQAKELALQASNGTLTQADRATIAKSLSGIVDDLLNLANTQDTRGQPLFGGSAGDAAYVRNADGSISYAGTGEASAIPIGKGDSVHPGVSGEAAFAAGDADMFAVLQALSAALASGENLGEASKDGIDGLNAALDNVSNARASIGARAFRLDLEAERLDTAEIEREDSRQGIEGVDPAAAISELQKTLTVLQATQASFTKLTSLSLFDYIR
jgi:flagellar hook-associated protein 3 FlgL